MSKDDLFKKLTPEEIDAHAAAFKARMDSLPLLLKVPGAGECPQCKVPVEISSKREIVRHCPMETAQYLIARCHGQTLKAHKDSFGFWRFDIEEKIRNFFAEPFVQLYGYPGTFIVTGKGGE